MASQPEAVPPASFPQHGRAHAAAELRPLVFTPDIDQAWLVPLTGALAAVAALSVLMMRRLGDDEEDDG